MYQEPVVSLLMESKFFVLEYIYKLNYFEYWASQALFSQMNVPFHQLPLCVIENVFVEINSCRR